MGFFNWGKKQRVEAKPIEFKCNHKWKDFPWYITAFYYEDTNAFDLKIIEPYVCIHCKERKDVVLHSVSRANFSWKQASKLLEECEEKYGEFCQPRPIVEDMIHDMQLIDRQYLEIAESLYPEKFGKLREQVSQGQLPELKT